MLEFLSNLRSTFNTSKVVKSMVYGLLVVVMVGMSFVVFSATGDKVITVDVGGVPAKLTLTQKECVDPTIVMTADLNWIEVKELKAWTAKFKGKDYGICYMYSPDKKALLILDEEGGGGVVDIQRKK